MQECVLHKYTIMPKFQFILYGLYNKLYTPHFTLEGLYFSKLNF